MAYVDIKNVRMVGVATCIPSHVEENKDYDVIPMEDRDHFVESIGIERRHVVEGNVCASDLCFQAAEHLLDKIGWKREEIELLVFVSQTPDYRMPSTSCVLQHRLALPKTCMTIDVSQGCSGYVYGLSVIGSIMASGTIKKGLLLSGNTQSRNINRNDKSVWPLFGDAGSATAFEYDATTTDNYKLSFMTDGGGEKTIIIPDGGYRNPVSADSFAEKEYAEGIKRSNLNIFMQGDDVFAFVIANIPKATRALYEYFSINQEDIDFYLMHHASKFIINKLIKKLSIPDGKAPVILKDYGNSSNASIPLLLCTSIREKVQTRKNCLYVSGFGVGLSLGVGVINVGELKCVDVIEI